MDFSTRIVISSHKSHGDDLARPRMFPMKGRMLLGSRLTFPLPVGAGVASDRIKVRTTAVQLAVAQNQDVDIADTRAIQEFGADFIKSVLNQKLRQCWCEKLRDGWQYHGAWRDACANRPSPAHSLHGAGKILRPGSTGCFTFG